MIKLKFAAITTAAILSVTLAGTVLAQQAPTGGQLMQQTSEIAQMPTPSSEELSNTNTSSVSDSEKNFLTKSAQDSLYEFASAQLAVQKAQDPNVALYGLRLMNDHAEYNQQLMQLARQKGIILPVELDSQNRSKLEQLMQLPTGTLGHEYAKHMKKYGIQPLEISADLQADAEENPLALRLLSVHDIYHVLLGFNITYAGEAGVFAFKAAQGYSKVLPLLQPLALIGICLMRPKSMSQTIANFRKGRSLGKQAKCLLTYRFADNWAKPVSEIRAEMGLIEQSNSVTQEVGDVLAQPL